MPPFCYLNGKIIPVEEARVSVYDIGLLRGFGIYEGLVSHNRKPFMLADHLDRLRNSAMQMSLKIPFSDAGIASAINELIERNIPAGAEALIRMIITGGEAIGGIGYDYENPTAYILVEKFTPIDQRYLIEGCKVIVFEHHRQIAGSKTTNYTQTVLLQKEIKKAGALEVLYVSEGKVLEGGGSNFFIVKDGRIITSEDGILPGVTRKAVINLARAQFPIEEREVSTEEMYLADESFITGSFKEIVPVVKVGDRTIADGKVGKVTKEVMKLFREFTRSY